MSEEVKDGPEVVNELGTTGRGDEGILEGVSIGNDLAGGEYSSESDEGEEDIVIHCGRVSAQKRPFFKSFGGKFYQRSAKDGPAPAGSDPSNEELKRLRFNRHITAFDVDINSLEEHPWRNKAVDLLDFFNYGFNEKTWMQYCEKQLRRRADMGLGPHYNEKSIAGGEAKNVAKIDQMKQEGGALKSALTKFESTQLAMAETQLTSPAPTHVTTNLSIPTSTPLPPAGVPANISPLPAGKAPLPPSHPPRPQQELDQGPAPIHQMIPGPPTGSMMSSGMQPPLPAGPPPIPMGMRPPVPQMGDVGNPLPPRPMMDPMSAESMYEEMFNMNDPRAMSNRSGYPHSGPGRPYEDRPYKRDRPYGRDSYGGDNRYNKRFRGENGPEYQHLNEPKQPDNEYKSKDDKYRKDVSQRDSGNKDRSSKSGKLYEKEREKDRDREKNREKEKEKSSSRTEKSSSKKEKEHRSRVSDSRRGGGTKEVSERDKKERSSREESSARGRKSKRESRSRSRDTKNSRDDRSSKRR